jgi:hypothetical protein
MNSRTISKVAATATKLHQEGSPIVTFVDLTTTTNKAFNLELYTVEVFIDRFRTIRALREEFDVLAHTISDDYPRALKYGHVSPENADRYIPAGKRRVYGLRFVKDERDPFLMASRKRGHFYNCFRTISVMNATIKIGNTNGWTSEDHRLLTEALYVRQALIEGNGVVTDAMRKMLGLREDIT